MDYEKEIYKMVENINDVWILRQIYIFIVNITKKDE